MVGKSVTMEQTSAQLISKQAVHMIISFRKLCLVTVALPMTSLLICFVTAYIFQRDDIHETHCRVSFFRGVFLCARVRGMRTQNLTARGAAVKL